MSLVQSDGSLVLHTAEVEIGQPEPNEVIIRIEAAPVHPSDQLLLLATADPSTIRSTGTADEPQVTAVIPDERLAGVAGRIGIAQAVGNEGAGIVVAAGENVTHLMGKTVACLGRGMYAEYIRLPASACYVLPDGITAAQGAASLVNPLTALTIVETMRAEGHVGLVHTAAASSLGQMLNRICVEDGIPLVNIVRKKEQADLLRAQGAQHVCVTADPDFRKHLDQALDATQATIAFDAIGGGHLIGQLLDSMETVAMKKLTEYSRYGSMRRKTIYVYGALGDEPIDFHRGFEFAWNISGWLVTPYLQAMSQERKAEIWQRISTHLTTTFATTYAAILSLEEILVPSNLQRGLQLATGSKFLIMPHKAPQ